MMSSPLSIVCQSRVPAVYHGLSTNKLWTDKKVKSGLAAILMFICIGSFAQEIAPAIKAAAYPYKDSIALRWAPDNAAAWQLINKYGYVVERFTLTRNNQRIEPEYVKLTNEPIKPRPLPDWESEIDNDDYMAIAAQAIYGTSFETSGNYSSDVLQVINQVKELEQRHSFALFSADLSRKVARWSALGLVDKGIKKNEKYVYKIYSAAPQNLLKVDTGYVFVGVEDFRELPKPIQLKAEPGDRVMLLSWNRSYYDDIYIAYHVERSSDGGKGFERITKLPLINSEPPEGLPSNRIYKLDSLEENGREYLYRVRGLTSFGDIGPISENVSGRGIKTFESNPAIVKGEVLDGKAVSLTWTFPKVLLKEVKGYRVLRSGKANGSYESLNENLIQPNRSDFQDNAPKASNYYKIEVVGAQGQQAFSFPYLVQLEDSIPPAPPKNLTAKIDNGGTVRINWDGNNEDDFLGYRVFRANYRGDEFGQITSTPVGNPEFVDTVSVKTLSNKIYYKVASLDQRYNSSAFSEIVEVKKPDLMPPVPPAFKNYKASGSEIFMDWSPSPSRDVAKHRLWRRDNQTKVGVFLAEFLTRDSVSSYIDRTGKVGELYEYIVEAEDSTGLKSRNVIPLQLRRISDGMAASIEEFKAEPDRLNNVIKLSWKYQQQNVRKYMIYRAEEEASISLYFSVNAEKENFEDVNTRINTQYKYRIKAVMRDGTESPFSKELLVEF